MNDEIGIFIGRFQPFHVGHDSIVKRMIEDNLNIILIVICGPPSPLDFSQRETMIKQKFDNNNIKFIFMEDFNNPTLWYNELMNKINTKFKDLKKIFYGHQKDVDKNKFIFKDKEYYGHYYDIFEIENHEVRYLDNFKNINARDIKFNKLLAKEYLDEEVFKYLLSINFYDV